MHLRSWPIEFRFLSRLFAVSPWLSCCLNGAWLERSGERRLHIIIPTFIAAMGLGLLAASLHSHAVLGLLALTVGSIVFAPTAVQSSYPASFLKGTSAATGWAVMNSVANLGGVYF